MDRKSNIITLVFLLISLITFGQCNDSIAIVQIDSCKKVQMSPKKFTEFYLYKKNLEKIKHEIPNVERKLDSLNIINKKIKENLEAEIDSTNKQKTVVLESLEDCSETLAEIDIENSYLTYRVDELEKRQWKMFGYGVSTTAVAIFIIKILVQ